MMLYDRIGSGPDIAVFHSTITRSPLRLVFTIVGCTRTFVFSWK